MSIEPCERIIEFTIPSENYCIADLFWMLSQQNRRGYRQGYELAVDKIELFQTDPTEAAVLDIYRMPQSWVTYTSWVKAYSHWQQQQRDAMRESGTSTRAAAYRDFKICYNEAHATGDQDGVPVHTATPTAVRTLASAQGIDPGAESDWMYSEFVVPNVGGNTGVAAEYLGWMLGGDGGTGKGLIHNYAKSRARPNPTDPSTVTDIGTNVVEGGLYAQMEDVGENLEEVFDNITERNASPPYIVGGLNSVEEFYPGGENSPANSKGIQFDRLRVSASTTGTNNPLSTDQTGSLTVPCGLLYFYNDSGSSNTVRVHVSPGGYKGVLALPMRDVN